MHQFLNRDICSVIIEEQLFGSALDHDRYEAPGSVGLIGIELEAFPYIFDPIHGKLKRPVQLNEGTGCLSDAIVRASNDFGGKAKYFDQDLLIPEGRLYIDKIEFSDGSSFQFEPGGQVEISTAPCNSMSAVDAQIKTKQAILLSVTLETGIHFAQIGTNPWFDVDEIGLQLKKPRYLALEKYLDGISPYGKKMMRQTCSLQVNLDLGMDHVTSIKRIVAANLLVPFVTALFANSSIIEGKINGHKSMRSYIWQHLDPSRTGILPLERISKSFHKEDLIDVYLEFALKAPVIFISDFGDRVFPKDITFEYWMAHPIEGLSPSISHFNNHLSLLFPEVRIKGYLELRSADAPPPQWQMVPAIFCTGLLYNDAFLDKTLEMLLPMTLRLPSLLEQSTFGMESSDIFDLSKKLMKLAIDGFSCLPDSFKMEAHVNQINSFYESYTLNRKTFADENLDRFQLGKSLVS